VIAEPVDPSLRDPTASEEELLYLFTVEVPIIGQGGEDGNVARGQTSDEVSDLVLAETLAGVLRLFADKERTTARIGSPSRCRNWSLRDQ
jgi:hypothetical protein